MGAGRGDADEPRSGRIEGCRDGFETFEEFPDSLTPQARNAGPFGQGLLPICPQTAPPRGRAEGKLTKWCPHTCPGPGPVRPCGIRRRPRRMVRCPARRDSECFDQQAEIFCAVRIDDSRSILQSSISGRPAAVRDSELSRLSKRCCTADPRTAAPQIRAPKHCATPFCPGEVRTSASWLFVQLERYAAPRDGPPAEPRWSTPCVCRNTATARRRSPDGRPGALSCRSQIVPVP